MQIDCMMLLARIVLRVFAAECNSGRAVLMVPLQSNLPHAVHWVWTLAAPEYHRGLADCAQYDGRGHLLCPLHWQHVNPAAVH